MEKGEAAIVYMVAGMSSRFGGKIKQFARVGPNGETLIEYSLNQAIKAGFSKIIFIVGNLTEKPFKEMFGDSYKSFPIIYALQKFNPEDRDKPWGTVDAVCTINKVIDCPFVVCNGDDIYGKETFKILKNHLMNSKEEASIGYSLLDGIPEKGKVNRGIFRIKNNYVSEIKETFNIEKNNLFSANLTEKDFCSMNIFALHPSTVKLLGEKLKKFKDENSGDRKIECLLPVELSNLIKEEKIKMKIYPTQDKWIGVTNPEDEEIVKQLLKNI